MNPENLLQQRLALTRNYRSAMDQAQARKAALSEDGQFRISPVLAYGQLVNRFNGQIVASAQALNLGRSSTMSRVQDLEKVVKDMGSDYAYGRCKEIAQALPSAEIVYWSQEQWEFAIDGAAQIGTGRVSQSDLPLTTQVWFFDGPTNPGYFDQFDSGGISLRDCMVECLILHPDGGDQVDVPAGLCATIVYRNQTSKERCAIMFPLISSWARVSTLKSLDDQLTKFFPYPTDLTQVEGTIIEVDDDGMVFRSVPMLPAQVILSAMLYMRESYVVTETRVYSTKGATTRGSKPEKHQGRVTIVNLRKRVYQTKVQEGESSRSYSCQFKVRTHWRHYQKARKSGKFMTRIPPYIKGPEDAPLRVKEKIYRVVS